MGSKRNSYSRNRNKLISVLQDGNSKIETTKSSNKNENNNNGKIKSAGNN